MTKHIVSFSGGKDSTAMLLMMIEKGMQIDKIICIDTTKEFPEMYEHIEKVQSMIEPLKIDIVKIDFDYYLSEHIKKKGKNKGTKGYGWPSFNMRWCTGEKKERIRIYMKQFENKSIINYHGIAVDEKERTNKNKFLKYEVKYPLVEWQITEKQALEYCCSKGLDWGGLYEDFGRVSCYCCPLSSLKELYVLYSKYPELWQTLTEMDKNSWRKFRSDYTLEQLEDRFEHNSLWDFKDCN